MTLKTKIAIIGAGPAGVAAALKLEQMGVPSILIDKASFPRSKVCGDAIGARAIWALNRVDEKIIETFRQRKDIKLDCWGMKIGFSNGKTVTGSFPKPFHQLDITRDKASAFICPRYEFDEFLFSWVRNKEHITLRENTSVKKYEYDGKCYNLFDGDGNKILEASLLLIADGPNSVFVRQNLKRPLTETQYMVATRGYFSKVTGFDKFNLLELHFLREVTQGYFWIFPSNNGHANVGLAIRADYAKKRKININKLLLKIIHTNSNFSERFCESHQLTKLKGGLLPVSDTGHSISGNNYLLLGDAARLADPFSGEGISNAIMSGVIAGEVAAESVSSNDYSKNFLKKYDQKVFNELRTEFASSLRLRKIMGHPEITNPLVGLVGSKRLEKIITIMYNDVNMRNKMLKPGYVTKKLLSKSFTRRS